MKKQAVRMNAWEDWFDNCKQLSKLLASYEDVLWSYYSRFLPATSDDLRFQTYAQEHNSKFYAKESLFPKWQLVRASIRAIPVTLVFILLACLVLIFLFKKPYIQAIQTAALVGAGAYLLCFIILILFSAIKLQLLKIKMVKMEDHMKPRIKYLPCRYRNSIAVAKFYDLFINYPGVLTYGQALQEVDSWFSSMPRTDDYYIGKHIAVMYDIPHEHTGLSGDSEDDTARELYSSPNQNIATANPALPKDIASHTFKGVDNPEEKLQSLVGLKNVKLQVRQLKNSIEFYNSRGDGRKKVSGHHMVFIGAPGTGKTTVARIMTRILYDFGYIQENKCVEIDGNYLKSAYAGDTTKRTSAILDFAKGGVLFIDEAYLLTDKSSDVGLEAIGTLIKYIEDSASELVVIFAGYEDAMNRFLAANDGLDSRIKHKIYFEDYSLDELMDIFDYDMAHCSNKGKYKLSEDARPLLRKSFAAEKSSPSFGNARTVRNALDMILDIHADHYMNGLSKQTDPYLLTRSDIKAYVSAREEQLNEDMRNYIARQNLDGEIISFNELKSKTKSGSSDPDKDLSRLVGLNTVKHEIEKMKAQFNFYDGQMGQTEGHHMCFVGAPGTGKTTVAEIMTGYLYKMGIIRRNEYLDINGDFLRGMYLGHTGKRTEAVIKYCRGMVLFLDEAYLLQQDSDGDKFGQEAIGVLIDAMEKYRQDFVVIVAGYDKEMNAFLTANSGMKSRISMTFHFESYSAHELAQMMNHLAHKDGFAVDKPVWMPLQKFLAQKRKDPYFGNGRYIRSFWQELKQAHIMRYSQGELDDDMKMKIDVHDLQAAMKTTML